MEVMPVVLFATFVGLVLGLSFYFASQAKSAAGYYAAGGTIHWFVNGIAFAGDYLSAASFLGICGMIATCGYDGFLYSIGYLAGWIVALFVVAEPMKRLGKYTFTDALDAKFNSKGIQLAAAISTIIVSLFYLIPQMVGAGVLITPLLGFPHYVGVILVGIVVITIVASAGMTSTTYVQFLKGGLLIIFSTMLVVSTLGRGFSTTPDQDGKVPFYKYSTLEASEADGVLKPLDSTWQFSGMREESGMSLVKLVKDGKAGWWHKEVDSKSGKILLHETQSIVQKSDGSQLINGSPASPENHLRQVGNLETIKGKSGAEASTGSVGPAEFLADIGHRDTVVKRWKAIKFAEDDNKVTVFAASLIPGNRILRPGLKFKVEGTWLQKLDFVSLMLALFLGTASLPHILIRYYTVPSPAAARKSTIVAIAAIGAFYILTLYMGLGAMTNGTINLLDDNMSAPLLARSFGTFLFSAISAIAFATVLGTVSGLIVAASGAVAHDLMDRYLGLNLTENRKVRAGKISAVIIGLVSIILGILFEGTNVSFLVGWAFSVAASANLPSIIMLLFWKRTTASGIIASIIVGIVSAMGMILLSPSMFRIYGLDPANAPFPMDNPGIFSIPLSFAALIIVSLMTQPGQEQMPEAQTA
ncbi:MAG: cation acetate symporter [Candidatus Riflebacteria bacterium HGW-Riflebacteria-2]|jgi:cation/acetate symporter|nr:MAG: cation acetate symporter [Candidatus Riflebacteria bacterium HGW-Riflebacteria-2]